MPPPSTIGYTATRYSSMRSCAISVCTSVALPYTSMSPPDSCLSRASSAATSPLMTVAFHGSDPVSVVEATSLGISFIRSR